MLQAFAFFDFDDTLISGDSILRFCLYAYKEKLISLGTLCKACGGGIQYLLGKYDAVQSKEVSLLFLKGKHKDELAKIAYDFCEKELLPNLLPQALACITQHQQAGRKVVLVSASPVFYLMPLKEKLGLEAVMGTELIIDDNGYNTGKIKANCKGKEKPKLIAQYLQQTQQQIDFAQSYAYGDSKNDIPMLYLCGNPTWANAKKSLRKKYTKFNAVHWKP